MLYQPWRITLFGTLTASTDSCRIERFRTKQVGLLLAFLAYFPERPQTREELADRLWPDSAPEQARANLRVALSSLRRQLEPPGIPTGSVLTADRAFLRLRPGSFTTDTAAFQAALRGPSAGESRSARAARLAEAAALYTGELLLGLYDEWVIEAREHLEGCLRRALGTLIEDSESLGDEAGVLSAALRLNTADPLNEKSTLALMRRAIRLGQPAEARREFERLEQRLKTELNVAPSAEALRLRDLARAPSVTPSFPPCAPIVSLPTLETVGKPPLRILPLIWTRFFGREAETSALCGLLAGLDVRLVTITGPGGAGKTRLAAQTAKRLADSFPGSVCFVPLADTLSAALLLDTIASSLRLSPADTAGPLDRIAEALSGTPSLLILDNLEQIADGAGPILQSLLARLPGLRCLVASRRLLHLPGERAFPLGPLPTPPVGEVCGRLPDYPSVQLFTDRAQAVRPDFQITPRNAAAIGALCTHLEGLPLALELAASWIGVLTPAQMLARLDARFALLISRSPESVKRHQTMHAAIAWSFDLLPADLREFWTKLSVFRGGWTAEAAEQVCGQPNALESLERLCERSLIVAEEAGEAMRFRMLESLREFAEEQREEANTPELQDRHARFFREFVEVKQLELRGASGRSGLDAVEVERANIAATLEWYDRPEQDPADGLSVAGALWRFWSIRGSLKEGQFWLERTLARASDCEPAIDREARAWNGLAVLVRMQGDLARACDLNRRALQLWRRAGDVRGIAASLNNVGSALMLRGDLGEARPLLEESLALWRSLDLTLNVAGTLQNLAYLILLAGDAVTAETLATESLELFRRGGDLDGAAHSLSVLASAAIAYRDFRQAFARAAEGLQIALSLGNLVCVTNCLDVLAETAYKSGQAARAAHLLGAVETLAPTVGVARDLPEEVRIAAVLEDLRGILGEGSLAAELALGRALSLDAATKLALTDPHSETLLPENPHSVQ